MRAGSGIRRTAACSKISARLLALSTTLLGVFHFAWIVGTRNHAHPYMSAAFLAAEVACLALFIVSTMTVWKLLYKPRRRARLLISSLVDVINASQLHPRSTPRHLDQRG